MAAPRELTGNILSASGWVRGTVSFRQRIETVKGARVDPGQNKEPCILPGFIDLHVHGGGGADFMDGENAAHAIAKLHARHGTTSLLATTVTAKAQETEEVLGSLGRACQRRAKGAARLLGVHLEGPYISARRRGAQPNHVRSPASGEVERYCALAPIRLLTLAPEVAMEVIQPLAKKGVRVQVGHTAGTYENGVAALKQGASGFTHLFNAMTGLHHREPGITAAALAHAEYAELIPDLHHVHPGAIRVALRAIPKLFCVTDSTSATGMPDGEYRLGSQPVTKHQGVVRLLNGTLAGSALTMDLALRNLASIGLTLEDASHRLSLYPATYLGIVDRGQLAVGAWADIVVLDRHLQVLAVFGEGEPLWSAE